MKARDLAIYHWIAATLVELGFRPEALHTDGPREDHFVLNAHGEQIGLPDRSIRYWLLVDESGPGTEGRRCTFIGHPSRREVNTWLGTWFKALVADHVAVPKIWLLNVEDLTVNELVLEPELTPAETLRVWLRWREL